LREEYSVRTACYLALLALVLWFALPLLVKGLGDLFKPVDEINREKFFGLPPEEYVSPPTP
jgi:hypothetical protein